MKKLILSTLVALLTLTAFAYSPSVISPAGNFTSYTKTEFSVTSKFGKYFRTPISKDIYVFDALTELLLSDTTYNGNDQITSKIDYKYDSNRNLVEEIYTDADGKKIWYIILTYQADGKISEESEYDASDKLIAKIIYNYVPGKTTESYYNGDGVLVTRNIKMVNADDKMTDLYKYYGDGSLSVHLAYTYLDDGRTSIIEEYDEANKLREKKVFKYDAKNFLAEIQVYDVNNILIQRQSYKNNEAGNPEKIGIYEVAEKFGSVVNELQITSTYTYEKTQN